MRISLFFVTALLASELCAQTPDWAWARTAAGAGNEEATDIVADGSGNVYVTGYFTSTVMAAGGSTVTNPASGSSQFFLAKYDRAGTLLWLRSAGGSDDDRGTALDVDGNGNVYVCGNFESTSITFGSNTFTNAGNPGQTDIFVVKYDPSGSVLWANTYGGGLQDEVNDIDVTSTGSFAITGNFFSLSVLFGGFGVINGGTSDAYVTSFNNSGTALWSKRIGGGLTDNGNGVAMDNSGNVYVTGNYNSTTLSSFSPAPSNAGGFDVYHCKFSSNGSALYVFDFGGTGDENATAMHATGTGDYFVAGYFGSGSIQIGSSTLNNSGTRNMFIAKFSNAGSAQWAQRSAGSQNSAPSALEEGGGNVYMSGSFDFASLVFGSHTISSGGSLDGFVVMFTSSAGTAQWAKATGSAQLDQLNGIALSGSNVHVAGMFTGTLVLRDNTLPTAGGTDAFVAKLCAPPPAPVSATGSTVCPGQPFALTANVPGGTSPVWFTSATGGSPIHTGSNFNPTSPGTFYAAAKDTNAGCGMFSSTRIAASAAHHPAVNPVVSVSGHTLTASGNGSVKAWYDCVSSSTITGQTGNSYIISASGHYAVIMVSSQGCLDTSACNHYSYTPGTNTVIVTTAVSQQKVSQPVFVVFPNPSSGVFEIRSTVAQECMIVNALGMTIGKISLDAHNGFREAAGPLPHGIYYIISADRRLVQRLIVSD